MFPVYLVLASLSLVVCYWYFNHLKLHSQIEKLYENHGPKPLPFIGNALDINVSSSENGNGILELGWKWSKEYERLCRVWLGIKPCIILYSPKDVEVLLNSTTQINKAYLYQFLVPWLGYGLLTSSGPKWKSRRRLITPTFHFRILEKFLDTIEHNNDILISKLRAHVDGEAFNLHPYTNLYALDNICETAMGVSVNAQKDSNSTFVRAVKDMCKTTVQRIVNPWLYPDLLFNLSSTGVKQREALKVLHEHARLIIRQKRQAIENRSTEDKNTPTQDNIDINQKCKMAFLDLILESPEAATLSEADIHEEVNSIIFGGHDTVTSSLAFACYALSKNIHVQNKLYEEQVQLLGKTNKAPTYQEIQEMKYMDRVIKETLRLYPGVAILGRNLTEDLYLDEEFVLPKGTQALIFTPRLHRDPASWPNPEVFDPDNFLPENACKRSPFAFVPFSAGPRNCIGQKYAMMEMKSGLSKIVRNFKLLPCPPEMEPKLVTEVVLVSANGINVRLQSRA